MAMLASPRLKHHTNQNRIAKGCAAYTRTSANNIHRAFLQPPESIYLSVRKIAGINMVMPSVKPTKPMNQQAEYIATMAGSPNDETKKHDSHDRELIVDQRTVPVIQA